jgi:hypothetical protein
MSSYEDEGGSSEEAGVVEPSPSQTVSVRDVTKSHYAPEKEVCNFRLLL